MTSQSLEVRFDDAGLRLDKFLANRCPGISRSRLQRLISDGHVLVDGQPVKSSERPVVGQRIWINVPDIEKSHLKPQRIPIDVVHDDADLIVVNKPAGMTVHPAPGNWDCTLANAVLDYCPDLQGIGGTLRPGIAHRLDKMTSGLVIVAKNDIALSNVSKQFKDRRVTKVYTALVLGRLNPTAAIIRAPIGRHPRDRKRMAVIDEGKPSETRYRTIAQYEKHTLTEVHPITGRTHQIRVHMASIGHSIVGDSIYGKSNEILNRHYLHAGRLEFEHPSTGMIMDMQSEIPRELQSFLDGIH